MNRYWFKVWGGEGGGVRMVIHEKAFAGLSVTTVTELLQLSQFLHLTQLFVKDNMKHIRLAVMTFKYAKLAEVVRQIDKLFTILPNKV